MVLRIAEGRDCRNTEAKVEATLGKSASGHIVGTSYNGLLKRQMFDVMAAMSICCTIQIDWPTRNDIVHRSRCQLMTEFVLLFLLFIWPIALDLRPFTLFHIHAPALHCEPQTPAHAVKSACQTDAGTAEHAHELRP